MSPINEDELRARLRSVEPSPAPPGLADHVIGQGRARRRQRRWLTALATAAAVAVIGVGVVAVGDQLGPDDALPASPSPTPTSAQPTPTVTATTTPTATGTSAPTATAPSATVTQTPEGAPSGVPSPASVTLLHEGDEEWSDTEFEGGVQCVGESRVLPTPQYYADLKVIRDGNIAGANRSEGLIVFPSASAAVTYMENVRRAAIACNDESSGVVRVLVEPLAGPWGDGVTVAYAQRDPHYAEPTYAGSGVTLLTRVGRAVGFASYSNKQALEASVDAEMVAQARPAVEHLFPQLCRYTQAGC